MKQTSSTSTSRIRLGQLRDTAIAVALIAFGVLLVIYYQIEAANTEPVSISSDSGGAASQMLSQSGGSDPAAAAASEPQTPLDRWMAGPHSDAFVVADDGTNSTCARCHDPINYVPTMDDMPASCNVCKFKVEPPPPFTDRPDAHHVDCKVCHRVDSAGTVLAGVTWLEVAAIEQYAEVSSVSQLCLYCHSGSGEEGHVDIHVAGAHAELACTDCHDEHSMAASCAGSGCHETLEEVPGHDAAHAAVNCVACHDASGLSVGPDEAAGGTWVTFAGPDGSAVPWVSHALDRVVACDRCHYDGNPWGLSVQ